MEIFTTSDATITSPTNNIYGETYTCKYTHNSYLVVRPIVCRYGFCKSDYDGSQTIYYLSNSNANIDTTYIINAGSEIEYFYFDNYGTATAYIYCTNNSVRVRCYGGSSSYASGSLSYWFLQLSVQCIGF